MTSLIYIAARSVSTLLALVMRGVILAYRYGLSPVLGPHCRFTPTCSAYADLAIRRHGPLRGGWLALRRIARCHPWGASGYDPVPATEPASVPLGHRNASS
jgi:putative membrane protein insertion efficiency factor